MLHDSQFPVAWVACVSLSLSRSRLSSTAQANSLAHSQAAKQAKRSIGSCLLPPRPWCGAALCCWATLKVWSSQPGFASLHMRSSSTFKRHRPRRNIADLSWSICLQGNVAARFMYKSLAILRIASDHSYRTGQDRTGGDTRGKTSTSSLAEWWDNKICVYIL